MPQAQDFESFCMEPPHPHPQPLLVVLAWQMMQAAAASFLCGFDPGLSGRLVVGLCVSKNQAEKKAFTGTTISSCIPAAGLLLGRLWEVGRPQQGWSLDSSRMETAAGVRLFRSKK